MLTGGMLLTFGGALSEIRAQILLAGVVIASGVAAAFWLRELRQAKDRAAHCRKSDPPYKYRRHQ